MVSQSDSTISRQNHPDGSGQINLPVPHGTAGFEVSGFLFERFTLIDRIFAFAKRQFDFDFAAFEIGFERNERQSFFADLALEPENFLLCLKCPACPANR